MTNAQIKVPLTPMPKVVFANKDQLKKAAHSNPGSLNNLGTWNPGTSARAVIALLKLTSILCKISNDYGDQVQEQIKASTTIAKATGQAQINQGDADFSEALSQGIAGIVGGALSLVGTIGTMKVGFNSSEIEGLENEEQGLQAYSERLENRVSNPGVSEEENTEEAGLDKHLKAIEEMPSEKLREMGNERKEFLKKNPQAEKEQISEKNEELLRKVKSTEESQYANDAEAIEQTEKSDATKLKEEVDKRLKAVREQKQSLMSDANSKMQTTSALLDGTQRAISGLGTASGAAFKKESAQYQKDQTLDRNAAELINGILGQNRNDEDKYFQNATDVNQVINAIRQANQIN